VALAVRLEVSSQQKPLLAAETDGKPVLSMALLLEAVLRNPVLALPVVALDRQLPRLRLVPVVPVPQLEALNHKHRPAVAVAAVNLVNRLSLKPPLF
jgi:DUF1365 family protein